MHAIMHKWVILIKQNKKCGYTMKPVFNIQNCTLLGMLGHLNKCYKAFNEKKHSKTNLLAKPQYTENSN